MPLNMKRLKERPWAPPPSFRLAFPLPSLATSPPPGRHQPNPEGCAIAIDVGGMVTVSGPSRVQVLEHARRFLRQVSRNRAAPLIIPAHDDQGSRLTIVIAEDGK